jgi:hypothetical protein
VSVHMQVSMKYGSGGMGCERKTICRQYNRNLPGPPLPPDPCESPTAVVIVGMPPFEPPMPVPNMKKLVSKYILEQKGATVEARPEA